MAPCLFLDTQRRKRYQTLFPLFECQFQALRCAKFLWRPSTWDEKVVLAKIPSASTNMIRKLSLSIYSYLLSFVHPESINIEHSDLHTGEVLNTRAD